MGSNLKTITSWSTHYVLADNLTMENWLKNKCGISERHRTTKAWNISLCNINTVVTAAVRNKWRKWEERNVTLFFFFFGRRNVRIWNGKKVFPGNNDINSVINKFTWKVAGTVPSSAANIDWYTAAVAKAVSFFKIYHFRTFRTKRFLETDL